MAMKGADFLKLTDAGIRKIARLQSCKRCKQPLQETVTGCRKAGKNHVCSDCYFEGIGKVLEEHPLFVPESPRTRTTRRSGGTSCRNHYRDSR
jgi:hypothetical protein